MMLSSSPIGHGVSYAGIMKQHPQEMQLESVPQCGQAALPAPLEEMSSAPQQKVGGGMHSHLQKNARRKRRRRHRDDGAASGGVTESGLPAFGSGVGISINQGRVQHEGPQGTLGIDFGN